MQCRRVHPLGTPVLRRFIRFTQRSRWRIPQILKHYARRCSQAKKNPGLLEGVEVGICMKFSYLMLHVTLLGCVQTTFLQVCGPWSWPCRASPTSPTLAGFAKCIRTVFAAEGSASSSNPWFPTAISEEEESGRKEEHPAWRCASNSGVLCLLVVISMFLLLNPPPTLYFVRSAFGLK